uniref:Uncharacterized protein n=1 Tax=Clastoptera arizonana TaxID=38151 RepID=A0A1B6CFJ4_9HEMI
MIVSIKKECSFNYWYLHIQEFCIPSVVIDIPEEVVKFLLQDGVVLPEEVTSDITDLLSNENDCTDGIYWCSIDDSNDEIKPPTFPDFSKNIQEKLNYLGGSVFIKLNWSAPTDAAWITSSKTLRCQNLEDIYLLLKSSIKVTKDLQFLTCDSKEKSKINPLLVLKKWVDILPGTEFRCFIANHCLIAISQRDCEYHSYLNQTKVEVIQDIHSFFNTNLKGKLNMENYVLDILRISQGNLVVLDVGLFKPNETNALLFDWEKLLKMKDSFELCNNIEPEFRYIGEPMGIQPNFGNHVGIPQDVKLLADKYKGLSLMDIIQIEVNLQNT